MQGAGRVPLCELACRHCREWERNSENDTSPIKRTYSLTVAIQGNDLNDALAKAEERCGIQNEITFFCHSCHQVSVISYEYYKVRPCFVFKPKRLQKHL